MFVAAAWAPAADGSTDYFDTRVAPKLKNGVISFRERASLLNGGSHGPAIVPGRREASILVAAAWAPAADGSTDYFDRKVAPILTRRCLGCHNEELKDGGISFRDRASLIKGGSHGPAIVPGKPEASMLVVALKHEGSLQMPPGPKLPSREISILTKWIRNGAVWGTKLR